MNRQPRPRAWLLLSLLSILMVADVTRGSEPMVLTEGLSSSNNKGSWKGSGVDEGPFAEVTLVEAMGMMGTKPLLSVRPGTPVHAARDVAAADLPASFDLLGNYSSKCAAVSRVLNQGACGSCYAMASTLAVPDPPLHYVTRAVFVPCDTNASILSCFL